jgi:hypothetical protein
MQINLIIKEKINIMDKKAIKTLSSKINDNDK